MVATARQSLGGCAGILPGCQVEQPRPV